MKAGSQHLAWSARARTYPSLPDHSLRSPLSISAFSVVPVDTSERFATVTIKYISEVRKCNRS